jgi:hypothetical protein
MVEAVVGRSSLVYLVLLVVYSNASGREDHLGAATVALGNNLEVIESQQV